MAVRQPPVMNPLLQPGATWVSLVVTLAAVLIAARNSVETIFNPNASVSDRVLAVCTIIVALGGTLHLSVSRSIISNVDNPPK